MITILKQFNYKTIYTMARNIKVINKLKSKNTE